MKYALRLLFVMAFGFHLISCALFNAPGQTIDSGPARVSHAWVGTEDAILVLFLMGIVAASCFLFSVYRRILRRRKQIELEIGFSKRKLSILSEEHERLAAEFEANTARYHKLIANLEFKRELLADIKSMIESATAEKSVDAQMRARVQRIVRNIHFSLHVDQEWDHFKSYFDKTDDGFIANLKQQYPDLSPNDCKLCVLYKMNKDHEAIAAIMEISAESARVMKHRLKKKLAVPANKDLTEFLVEYGTSRIEITSLQASSEASDLSQQFN